MPIRGSPNGLRHFIHTVLGPWRLAVTLGWNGWSPSIGILRVELGRAWVLPATNSGATQLKPR